MESQESGRRELQLMDDCARIFSGPYGSAKQLFIENEWEFEDANVEMNQRLLDALEYVDNTFECIASGDIDEAEEWVETLDDHACQTVCDAAQVLAERERDRLLEQRYRFDFLYSLSRLSEVPPREEHDHMCSLIDEKIAEGNRLGADQWEEAFEKYSEATNKARELSNRTPKKATVQWRLLKIVAAIGGVTSAASLIGSVLLGSVVPLPVSIV